MLRLHRHLVLTSRLLICIAVLFSLISGLTFWNRVLVHQNRKGYELASFVVTGATFQGDGDGTVEYWLIGSIAGGEERFLPRFASRSHPKSADDLLRVYPKGTEIRVVYNRDVSDLTVRNGEALRVIQAGPDFWVEESRRFRWAALLTFVPIPFAVSVFFVVRFVSRRRSLEAPHAA